MRRGSSSRLRGFLRSVNLGGFRRPSVEVAEPRRLVEMTDVSDPHLRWGAELVRRAGSVEPSRLMQARVRERLDAAQPPLRRRVRWVRAAPLAALLLAAGAGATVGRGWVQNLVAVREEAAIDDGSARVEAPRSSAARVSASVAEPVEPSSPVASVEVAPTAVPSDHDVEPPRGTTARKSTTSTITPKDQPSLAEVAPETPTQVRDQGSQLMVDALQARRAKRYTEASKLAQQYLTQYPRGPLGEEALGLVMEAAANTGSSQRHALARRYLQRFPKGRFTATAQRILQAP